MSNKLKGGVGAYWAWVDALPVDPVDRVRAILTRQDRGYGVSERELQTLCRGKAWRTALRTLKAAGEVVYRRRGVAHSSKVLTCWRLRRR